MDAAIMELANSVLRHQCHCDLCKRDLFGRMRYDAKTSRGGWSVMCHGCWMAENGRLGIGIGQKFDAQGRCVAGNKTGQIFEHLPENVVDLETYLGLRGRERGGR